MPCHALVPSRHGLQCTASRAPLARKLSRVRHTCAPAAVIWLRLRSSAVTVLLCASASLSAAMRAVVQVARAQAHPQLVRALAAQLPHDRLEPARSGGAHT